MQASKGTFRTACASDVRNLSVFLNVAKSAVKGQSLGHPPSPLQSLILADCHLGRNVLDFLDEAMSQQLTHLCLSQSLCGDQVLLTQRFFNVPWVALVCLDLSRTRFSPGFIRKMTSTAQSISLQLLNFSRCDLNFGMVLLLQAVWLPCLQTLDLSHNPLKDWEIHNVLNFKEANRLLEIEQEKDHLIAGMNAIKFPCKFASGRCSWPQLKLLDLTACNNTESVRDARLRALLQGLRQR